MQVARLLEPRPERTLGAKFAEMIRAVQLESRLSKDEILALYLALAPYGGNLEGTRAASLAYFGKEPQAPVDGRSRHAGGPAAGAGSAPARSRSRAPRVPRATACSLSSRARASSTPIRRRRPQLEPTPRGRKLFPMLAAHVAERLVKRQRSAKGQSRRDHDDLAPLQEQLENLARERATALGGGVSVAIIAVDNATGEVRAHVGGVGYFDKARAGQIDLAQALRSPGSTLKPFIYGLAFEDGLAHPETLVDDRPIRFGIYKPENFDDAFQGTVTMRRALQQSLNVPAVMLLNALGPNRLIARMKNAGAAPQSAAWMRRPALPSALAAPG